MKSTTRVEYLRNNGTFSEVYSMDNPPSMSWQELVYEENSNGIKKGQSWGTYGGKLTPNSIYAAVFVIYNQTIVVTVSNISKVNPYALEFGFSCGGSDYQFGKISLGFESDTNVKFESLNGMVRSNAGSWAQIDENQVFFKGIFKLVMN